MALGACRSLALYFEDMNIQGILERESRMGSNSCFQSTSAGRQTNLHHSRKSRGLSKSEHAEVESNKSSALHAARKMPLTQQRMAHHSWNPCEHSVSSLLQEHLQKASLSQPTCCVPFQSQWGCERHQSRQWHTGPCVHVPMAGPQGCMSAASPAWHPELCMPVHFMAWASMAWLRGESREDRLGAGLSLSVWRCLGPLEMLESH